MALPNKKISKVKTDSSNTYDIVSQYMTDGSTDYAATLSTLTGDSTIVVEGPSKTYTGLYTTPSDSYANGNFYFIKVMPTTWQTEWSIQYRLECDLDDGLTPTDYQYMHSTHECFISGARGLYSAYAFINNINYTSRRVIGYHTIAKPTETGFNNDCGYMVGISLYYNGLAYSATSASYKRTIKVTILKTRGCTATLEAAPLISHNADRSDYTKLNSTYYPNSTSDSNTAGYLSLFNAYSNGLQETSDDNSTDLIYYHNQYSNIGSFGLPGYTIFGFSPDGKLQAISLYQSGYTSYTTSISTTRVYNTNGFDYSKALLRWASSGFYAGNTADVNIHSYKTQVFDFRYTDNCVSTAGTTLSFIRNKEIYLRGTIGTDGLFYLAPLEVTYNGSTYKRAWTQDTPTTEDGYVYWLLGHPYSTDAYQLRLYVENPLYWFKDGEFRSYTGNSGGGGSGVNIISLSTASLTVDVPVELTITEAEYNTAIDETKDCIVKLSVTSDDTDYILNRIRLDTDSPQKAYFLEQVDYATLGSIYVGIQNNSGTYKAVIMGALPEYGTGTVKSVNNTAPDANGNVSISIPTSFNLIDDILDGSANKYAPYTTKGAGHFYNTDTTAPSSTNRLNYDGYFYATALYKGSTEVKPITINTTNKTISDGTNTFTFGDNAFNSTAIPSSYISSSSYNSSTKVLTITPNSGTATTITFGDNAFTSTSIPTTYVSTVNGSSGAITNVALTNTNNNFSAKQTFFAGISIDNDTSSQYPLNIEKSGTFKLKAMDAVATDYNTEYDLQNNYLVLKHVSSSADSYLQFPQGKGSVSGSTITYATLATTDDIPTSYVSSINGDSGAITNVAKTNESNSFTATQKFSTGAGAQFNYGVQGPTISFDGNNLIITGSTYASSYLKFPNVGSPTSYKTIATTDYVKANASLTPSATLNQITVNESTYSIPQGTVTSVATSGTGLSGGTITTSGTITLNSNANGNRNANQVVIANAAGTIQTEKLAISSGSTTKATMQYDGTNNCVKFVF